MNSTLPKIMPRKSFFCEKQRQELKWSMMTTAADFSSAFLVVPSSMWSLFTPISKQ
jgi:hypothetical protein